MWVYPLQNERPVCKYEIDGFLTKVRSPHLNEELCEFRVRAERWLPERRLRKAEKEPFELAGL
jgi:NAD-dependent DNA ligase